VFFNWLAHLDSHALPLPQASSWLDYPYFMFARYPRLQPEIPEQKSARSNNEIGRNSFQKLLSDQESQIAGHENGAQILQGMTPEQRQQLSALVVDCLAEFKKHRARAEHGKHLTRLTKEASRRQRRLDKLVGRVRTALEQLHSYTQDLDPWLGRSHSKFALRGLMAIGNLRHYQSAEEWEKDRQNHLHFAEIAEFSPFPDDPTSSAMVQLYWLFRHECHLSANEAQIRTARSRDACFAKWNKSIAIVEKHTTFDSESRGASAVAQAVRRYRPKG
jgi:hypothetical protein